MRKTHLGGNLVEEVGVGNRVLDVRAEVADLLAGVVTVVEVEVHPAEEDLKGKGKQCGSGVRWGEKHLESAYVFGWELHEVGKRLSIMEECNEMGVGLEVNRGSDTNLDNLPDKGKNKVDGSVWWGKNNQHINLTLSLPPPPNSPMRSWAPTLITLQPMALAELRTVGVSLNQN